MSTEFADRLTERPSRSVPRRMTACMWRQAKKSAHCPMEPRLDNKVALVTGGGRGIGLETSRGLARRGAEIIMASRGEEAGKATADELQAEFSRPAHFVSLDLSDLREIPGSLDRIEDALAGRTLDILIANAGLWPTSFGRSAQGHEIAFATNVLGHHALVQGAIERGLLSDDARVVIVTGDIYILSEECTPDYTYRGAIGGQLAYCRSKLGNLWYARELARREPGLNVTAVHPGVIASELGGIGNGLVDWIKGRLMLSVEQGAQTSLFCATQPGLPSGSYFHNVLGRVELDPADPGADDGKARALWDLLEERIHSVA